MGEFLCCKVAVAAATYAIDKPYTYLVPSSFSGALQPGMRVIVPFGQGNRRSEGIVLSIERETPSVVLKSPIAILDDAPVLDQNAIRLALWMRERYFCTVYTAAKAMLPAGLSFALQDNYRLSEGMDRARAYGIAEAIPSAHRILDYLFSAGGQITRQGLCEACGQTNLSKALNALLDANVLTLETSAKRGIRDKEEEMVHLALPGEEALALIGRSRSKLQKAAVQLLCQVGSASVKDIDYFTGAKKKTLKTLEKAGIVSFFHREIFRRPDAGQVQPQTPPRLNQEQETAFQGLLSLARSGAASCALLYGVTGSGKTSVYINLIHQVLADGKAALVLVPEISLTPQLLRQFTAQFGDQVALLHSSLPAGERYDEWKRARQGEARVVVGTRSAIFAPVPNLGLIVLDEEQEASYKSENAPRYHAREIAKYRCAQQNALLLLSSATPSVETMFFAKSGKYHLFSLSRRYNQKAMPEVLFADLKEELRSGNDGSLSRLLQQEIQANLQRGEQTILFLNRRGSSRMVQCAACGEVPECGRCSVKLTYHRANNRLMCHYCGHSEPLPDRCPVCGGELVFLGFGTQKLEEELKERFPGTPVLRMDADTISASHTHRELLERFEREQIPILIGTQMVAKGLDFSHVSLVGVIDADLSLYIDDFRAGERTFSLLTQVIGRAGRGEIPGRAVIQTFTPKNELLQAAARQDYETFYQGEVTLRKLRHFPPFSDLVLFTLTGQEEGAVLRSAMRLREGLLSWQSSPLMAGCPFSVLGPAPANIVKVNNRYHYRITVNGSDCRALRHMVSQLLFAAAEDRENRNVAVSADINPLL